MSEHKIPIPSRVYNAAVDGHVAGADQIIDDKTGLTLDKVAGGALEEKEYTSGSNNGMGRVVLRKNLVNGVNTLTQSMVNQANTIYVIQYDFILGDNITIPENCVLKFDGGSISGAYTLTGTNTGIQAGLVKIFNTNITLAGTWNLNITHPEWFGSVGDGTITDDTLPIQKAINLAELGSGRKKVVLSKPHRINGTITINTACFDGGANAISYYGSGTAISLIGNHYMGTIKNFVLYNAGGNGLNGIKNENEGTDTSAGLNNSWIEKISIYSFLNYGFHFSNAWLCNLRDLRAEECGTGIYINRGYNCKLYNINAEKNNIGIDLHILSSSLKGCCLDGCKQIGIKLFYIRGCSIEDIHIECNSNDAIGIKFVDAVNCKFKNIFASTDTSRNFTLFDMDSGDTYCTGHIFEDISCNVYDTDYIFNLSSYDSNYLRVYNISIVNGIYLNYYKNLYRGGTGIITWLNESYHSLGVNTHIVEQIKNGIAIPLFAETPNNPNGFQIQFETIRNKQVLAKLNTNDTWIASQSHVSKGVLKVYTNYGTAIYYYDVSNSIFNLLNTSNSSVFNPSGLRAGFDNGNVIFTCSGITPTADDIVIFELLNEL